MTIANKTIKFITVFVLVFTSLSMFANIDEQEHQETHKQEESHHQVVAHDNDGKINQPGEVQEYIKHHLKDAHDFHLFSYTDNAGKQHHIGFPLPVITWTSKGLRVS